MIFITIGYPTLLEVPMNRSETVLRILEEISGTNEVRENIDIELFTEKILDSFGSVELVVALSDAFHLNLSPAQITREEWATPRKIIAYIDERTHA